MFVWSLFSNLGLEGKGMETGTGNQGARHSFASRKQRKALYLRDNHNLEGKLRWRLKKYEIHRRKLDSLRKEKASGQEI